MARENKTPITYAYLTFAMLCWGLSFVWYKQALDVFGPISLVLIRLLISLPLVFIAAILLKRLKKIQKKDIGTFLLLAFFEPFLYFIGEANGMQHISSTVASILIATIPLFTSIFAFFFLNEKLTTNNYLGMTVSFIGVVLVIFSDQTQLEATLKGLLLMLVAVFSAVIYGIIIKRVADKYSSLTIVSYQNLFAIIYFLPVFLLIEHRDVINTNLTWKLLLPVIYLAVFATTFAYIGFIQGVKHIGLSKATVFTNFIPIFTAIFAFFILNEQLTILKTGGIVFVIVGLILMQAGRKAKKVRPEEKIVNELY